MKILALELSTALGSVAFRGADGLAIVRQFAADRKHSGLFYENLSELREECGLPELIAVGLGPGSYAGIRIAIATALGLREASAAQLVGLPSICAIDCPEYGVVGDARRSSYFFARVKAGNCIEGPSLMSEEELRCKLREESGLPIFTSQALSQFEGLTLAYPSALLLATLAERIRPNDEPLQPIYLRQPYITQAKTIPWTR